MAAVLSSTRREVALRDPLSPSHAELDMPGVSMALGRTARGASASVC